MKVQGRRVGRQATGFTLVELLAVIAIIGILIALLLPAVQAAREASRRMSCSNNLWQIGVACHDYHSSFNIFPPGRLVYTGPGGNSIVTGFLAMALPFMEGSNLHEIYDQTLGFDHPDNQEAVNTKVSNFLCPSTPGDRITPIYCGWNLGWTTDVSAMPSVTGAATDYFGVRGMHLRQPDGSGGYTQVYSSDEGVLAKAMKIGLPRTRRKPLPDRCRRRPGMARQERLSANLSRRPRRLGQR